MPTPTVASAAATAVVTGLLALLTYRVYFHPLKDIPGPLVCKLTSLWTYYRSYVGDECSRIDALHKVYGPIVRIAPNEVVIADGAALAPIYSEKGGFRKAECYRNFDIEGHSTIFSELDPAHRAVRSKAVLPLFSMGSIRGGEEVLVECVDRFIERLRVEATQSRQAAVSGGKATPVNIMNLARSLAVDAVSSYLFQKSFDAVNEKGERMSASSYVDALVAFGRFFFMPNWIFLSLEHAAGILFPDTETDKSMSRVDSFTRTLRQESQDREGSYQSRLVKTGITDHEIEIQCKDLIFAGTDSTGMNLSTICWNLAKHPDVYKKLQQSVADADEKDPKANPQSIPYLDAVVREGLRLSMANPTRLPRVVPPQGWSYAASSGSPSYDLPAGTLVGLQVYTLHMNPDVFPDPEAFKPERWLDNPTPEMQRDSIPFGLGQRQCIARNLAQTELLLATRKLARDNTLDGAEAVGEKIRILEWFNSRVVGERIDIVWK
ncbi:putative P450 monooxygenase [Polychaeton citri CBS 116435]|uniref:P450 monooxygenase n=1 Tax=Polychaeton citri CBS 116435 TaxID=1314669 RepID=A0A9P4UU85_9PEZI|nr:putative P450 monooxygenase [Polychaeton citri CBS 116435]